LECEKGNKKQEENLTEKKTTKKGEIIVEGAKIKAERVH
jgi:hypothetical protein